MIIFKKGVREFEPILLTNMVDEGKEPIIEKRASMPYSMTHFDRSVDMKIWNRRFKIYWLWLEGDLTQQEIADTIGYNIWTVNKDLAAVREALRFVPERLDDFIRETYMRMVFTRNEIQQEARAAEKPSDKAKLYDVVADYDKKILERFTQRGGKTDVHIESPDMGKYALEYLAEIYGPEAVEHCLEWMEKKVRFQGAVKR